MTQDLFVRASDLEIEIATKDVPDQSIRGVNFLTLYDYLVKLHSGVTVNDYEVWALFLVAHVDWHSIYRKQETDIKFETYALKRKQYPVWHQRTNYTQLVQSGDDAFWRKLAHSIPNFLKKEPTLPTEAECNDGSYYFELMFKKIAIQSLKCVECDYKPTGNFPLVSPNTHQVIELRPQHPSGLHLFCSFAGETYEEAINSAMNLAEYSQSYVN